MKALQQSEDRYRNIVESNPDFINRYLPGGILTYVNPALARFSGCDAESFFGKSFYPFIHEDHRQETIRQIESISRDNPIVETENRTVLPDGKVFWTRWTQTGIFDDQGNLDEYQSVGKDITTHRQAEDALRNSEEMLKLAQQGAGAGCWDWDIETGQQLSNEYRVVLPDGQIRWVNALGNTVVGPSGKPIRMTGICTDITERKRAEEKVRESEYHFRSLFEEMTEGVALHSVVRDDSGTIVNYRIERINPAYTEILGISPEEVTAKLATEVYGIDTPPYLKEYSDVVNSKKSVRFSTYFPQMDKHFDISTIKL